LIPVKPDKSNDDEELAEEFMPPRNGAIGRLGFRSACKRRLVSGQSELDDYLQLEHIMIMAKARARQHRHLGQ
jgi:hypothetical protein